MRSVYGYLCGFVVIMRVRMRMAACRRDDVMKIVFRHEIRLYHHLSARDLCSIFYVDKCGADRERVGIVRSSNESREIERECGVH